MLAAEEGAFATTLEKGQKILDELLSKALSSQDKSISGSDAFLLYDTFGFPLELTQEIAEQKGVSVDESGFESEMESQRKRSKDSREEVDMTAVRERNRGWEVGRLGGRLHFLLLPFQYHLSIAGSIF